MIFSHPGSRIQDPGSFEVLKKKIWPNFQRITELFNKKMSKSSSKYGLGIRDPRSGFGSGIQDPDSDPRSKIRIQIRDPRSGFGSGSFYPFLAHPDLGYLRLLDPDSGGPKTCGSGSGSGFSSGSAILHT